MGDYILNAFKNELEQINGVREIRGQGLMIGIELEQDCAELVKNALEQHLGKDVIDIVLVNSQVPRARSFGDGIEWVKPDIAAHGNQQVVYADLLDEMQAGRHDSQKLAGELVAMLR